MEAKMDFKKIFFRILFFGILLGVLMFVVGKLFHLSQHALILALTIAYMIFIIIFLPYQYRKGKLLNNKMGDLMQKLYDGKTKEYIAGIKKLLNEMDNDYFKAILSINMAVGYTAEGEFEKAISYLENIDANKIDKRSHMVLYHNIACNAFWAGETKKACIIMEMHKELLEKGLEMAYSKNSFCETFALWYFAKGDRNSGFVYLEKILSDKYAKDMDREFAQLIWAKEKLADGEKKEAKTFLEKIFAETKMPYLKEESSRILKQLETERL